MNPELIAYFKAFEHTNQHPNSPKRITRKEIADSGGIREADVSNVFRFYGKKTSKEPKPIQLTNVHRCLRDNWEINRQGFLVRKITEVQVKKVEKLSSQFGLPAAPSVKIYTTYPSAEIAAAVQDKDSGKAILLINTYISSDIYDPNGGGLKPGTLKHWLDEGKEVKILILYPERHAMHLRAKSLDEQGATLANLLIGDLKRLLEYEKKYPNKLEVRLMDEIPGVSAVILENKVFYGLHLSFGHTETIHHIEMPIGTDCKTYDNILRHFNTIWGNSARAKPLDQDLLKNAENALLGVRNLQETLIGTWNMHLHDLSDVLNGSGSAPFDSVVGDIVHWSLEITKPEKGIYLRSKLTLLEGKEFDARVITGQMAGEDYAHIRYTNFQDLTLHFSFKCRPDRPGEPLLGYFLLNTGTDSCSGYVVLIKNTEKVTVSNELPTYFRRLLSFRDGSYFSLARVQATRDRFNQGLYFAGTYRVYSYGGRRDGPKGIKINWLHIDDAGIARYKNQRFTKGDELIGRATYIASNLHIMSTYYRRGVAERRGYLIAKVSDNNYPQKGRFYGAVNLGVSFENNQIPNGKRFILEYVEDVNFEEMEHKFLPVHSPEYKKLPDPIKGLLTGRVKNMNGFLRNNGFIYDIHSLEREWEDSIKLGLVFYDSAVQHVRRGEYDDAMDMLSRAVYHGLDNLINFEEEVDEFDSEGLEIMKKMKDYLKIRDILSQDSSNFDPVT